MIFHYCWTSSIIIARNLVLYVIESPVMHLSTRCIHPQDVSIHTTCCTALIWDHQGHRTVRLFFVGRAGKVSKKLVSSLLDCYRFVSITRTTISRIYDSPANFRATDPAHRLKERSYDPDIRIVDYEKSEIFFATNLSGLSRHTWIALLHCGCLCFFHCDDQVLDWKQLSCIMQPQVWCHVICIAILNKIL